jgi:prophage maintenance system killer protein
VFLPRKPVLKFAASDYGSEGCKFNSYWVHHSWATTSVNCISIGCFHLTVEIAREIHAEDIARFGGADGVRDSALLESAVAAPQASFGGRSPYRNLAEVAAACLYHLCRNQPFVDGKKRAALGACVVFFTCSGSNRSPMDGNGRTLFWR